MFPTYDGNKNVLGVFDAANSAGVAVAWPRTPAAPSARIAGVRAQRASRFPFRWSTKYTDNETGLVYYGYRYYSPGMGRWVNRDPSEKRWHKPPEIRAQLPIMNSDSLGLGPYNAMRDFVSWYFFDGNPDRECGKLRHRTVQIGVDTPSIPYSGCHG